MYYTPPPLQFDASGKPIPNMPNLVYQANAYFEAGQKAFYKNDMEFAESYLKKSIECRDKLNKVREAKEYVTGVNLLGKVLRKRNKWEEAEKYYRQALSMATQGLGLDAYEVKECQLNLSRVLRKAEQVQGRAHLLQNAAGDGGKEVWSRGSGRSGLQQEDPGAQHKGRQL